MEIRNHDPTTKDKLEIRTVLKWHRVWIFLPNMRAPHDGYTWKEKLKGCHVINVSNQPFIANYLHLPLHVAAKLNAS